MGLEQLEASGLIFPAPWTVLRERRALSRADLASRPPGAWPEPLEKAPCSRRTQGHGSPTEAQLAPHAPQRSGALSPPAKAPHGLRSPSGDGGRRWQAPGTGGGSRLPRCAFRNSVSVRYIISNWLRSVNKSETRGAGGCSARRMGAGHSGLPPPGAEPAPEPGPRRKGACGLPGAVLTRCGHHPPRYQAAKERRAPGSEVSALALFLLPQSLHFLS